MTSRIVSPISCRSPSMRVLRLKEVLEAFNFFRSPTCSLGHFRFSCANVVYGSTPPSSVSASFSSEGDFCLLVVVLLLSSQHPAPAAPLLLLLHSFSSRPTTPYVVFPPPFSSMQWTSLIPLQSWLKHTTLVAMTQAQ